MIINTSRQAIAAALRQTRNTPGTCQLTVRGWFNSPSVGDVDGDGDADAVDGWKSEPTKYRHPGDRNPPGGVPLAFHGGSKGYGHRAMTLRDPGRIRSTDMSHNTYTPGVTSTVVAATTSQAIAIIERSMDVTYTGWSETCDRNLIPNFAAKPVEMTRGRNVDAALRRMRRALANIKPTSPLRAPFIKIINRLLAIPQRPVR